MDKKVVLGFAVGPIGSAVLGFVSVPVVAWYFPVEAVGRLSMLQVAISFSTLLCCLGLDQAYVREYHETADKATLLRHTTLPGLIVLVFILTFMFLYDAQFISHILFTLDSKTISIVVGLCLVAAFISRFLSLILRMQERGLAFSMSQVLPKLAFLIVIIAYVALQLGNSFDHLLYAQAVSLISVLCVFAWNTRASWLPAFKLHLSRSAMKPLLSFGFPLIFAGLASWGLTAMDRLLLRSLSSFEELGLYSVAASVAAVATIFSGIFNTLWMPSVYKWVAEGTNLEKIDVISEHVLAAVYFVLVIFGLFSWVLPYIFPSAYENVQNIIMACAAGPLLYTLSETTTIGINITRKTVYALVASGVAVAVNAICNYGLIPFFGAGGAAASTALAFFFFLMLRTEFSCLLWRPRKRGKLYFSCVLVVAVSVYLALSHSNTWVAIAINLCLLFIGFVLFSKSIKILLNVYGRSQVHSRLV